MNRFLSLDFEGTSKEPRQGYPAQCGVALFVDGKVVAEDEFLMRQPRHYKTGRPTRVVDANSLDVWGMTLERLEFEGMTAGEGCARLRKFVHDTSCRTAPVLAYNVSYDIECYGQMLFDGGCYDRFIAEYIPQDEILSHRWVDAFRLARATLAGKLIKFDLDSVAAYYGLSRATDKHGALEDAKLAGHVYLALMGYADKEAVTA